MRKSSLTLALVYIVALLGAAPATAAGFDAVKRQHRQVVGTIAEQRRNLRRAETRVEVTRATFAARRQLEAFARTVDRLSPDQLTAIFLKLNIVDPNGAPAARNALRKELARLRKISLAMAQAQKQAAQEKAEEAEQAAEGDLAEDAAEAVEELIEEAEEVVASIMGFFGL
jgi:hypothetical protein